MVELSFKKRGNAPLRVLCLGAHSDDVEVGCGGAVLKLLDTLARVEVRWVVFSANPVRAREARRGAAAFLRKAHKKQVTVLGFRDAYFPYIGGEVKEAVHRLAAEFFPDVIFTQYGEDRHQDHRLLAELTWNAFRDHLILEYEVPKYDGDMGSPNVYVSLTRAQARRKVRILLNTFQSQRGRDWFTEDTFLGLLRLRGVECNAPEGYAEAFYGRKLVL